MWLEVLPGVKAPADDVTLWCNRGRNSAKRTEVSGTESMLCRAYRSAQYQYRYCTDTGNGSSTFFFVCSSHTSTFHFLDKPWSKVSSLLPPRFLASLFIAHRVEQPHCSSIFHRVLLAHAPALSASQFVHKKRTPRASTSVHSGRFEVTKLTYTRLEDNLRRHLGDWLHTCIPVSPVPVLTSYRTYRSVRYRY